jgi:trehalose-6-phosphate synthase
VPREELVAYYRAADVCLVNPLRDGMNLVSMEYVACRGEDGVLVLSELAGAAHALGNAALLVNPFAIQETAMALSRALEMDAGERAHRMRRLMKRVEDTDVHRWLERILGAALSGDGMPSGEMLPGPPAEAHDLAAVLPSPPGPTNPFH